MTEFKLQIDSKPFKDKPKGVDIAGIKTRLVESKPVVATVRQLARENKVAHVYAGNKLLINVDSLFDFLNGKGA